MKHDIILKLTGNQEQVAVIVTKLAGEKGITASWNDPASCATFLPASRQSDAHAVGFVQLEESSRAGTRVILSPSENSCKRYKEEFITLCAYLMRKFHESLAH